MLQRYALSDNVDRMVTTCAANGRVCWFRGNTMSGRPFEFLLPHEEVNRWANGEPIQNCFPYLTAEEQEIMITGMDDESWKTTFGDSDE